MNTRRIFPGSWLFLFIPVSVAGWIGAAELDPVIRAASGHHILITDNRSVVNNEIRYAIGPDSLIITGMGDYGRSKVNYFSRRLTRTEKKTLRNFILQFPLDSLDDLYQDPFNPMAPENANRAPRMLEIEIGDAVQSRQYKTINCFVRYNQSVFDCVNPMLPPETRIAYDKTMFNAFY